MNNWPKIGYFLDVVGNIHNNLEALQSCAKKNGSAFLFVEIIYKRLGQNGLCGKLQ